MAREKYDPSQNIDNLSKPEMWITWIDTNGETHHTPRSFSAIVPPDAEIINEA